VLQNSFNASAIEARCLKLELFGVAAHKSDGQVSTLGPVLGFRDHRAAPIDTDNLALRSDKAGQRACIVARATSHIENRGAGLQFERLITLELDCLPEGGATLIVEAPNVSVRIGGPVNIDVARRVGCDGSTQSETAHRLCTIWSRSR
jgi:hypothetical protein